METRYAPIYRIFKKRGFTSKTFGNSKLFKVSKLAFKAIVIASDLINVNVKK